MSIYDKIQECVYGVKMDVSEGKDINDSIINRTKGMTKEAIQRVIEETNVKSFLDILKTGQDRSQEFPLADPNKIFVGTALNTLNESDIKNIPTNNDDSFYENIKKSSLNKWDFPIEKKACAVDEKVQKHNKYIYENALYNKKCILEKRADIFRQYIISCEEGVKECMEKMANYVCCNNDRATELYNMSRFVKNSEPIVDSVCKMANAKYNKNVASFVAQNNDILNMLKTAQRGIDTIIGLKELIKSGGEVKKFASSPQANKDITKGWHNLFKKLHGEQGGEASKTKSLPMGLTNLFSGNIPSHITNRLKEEPKELRNEIKSLAKKQRNEPVSAESAKLVKSYKEYVANQEAERKTRYEELEEKLKKVEPPPEEVVRQVDNISDHIIGEAIEQGQLFQNEINQQKKQKKQEAREKNISFLKSVPERLTGYISNTVRDLSDLATIPSAWGGGVNKAIGILKDLRQSPEDIVKATEVDKLIGKKYDQVLKQKKTFLDLMNNDEILNQQDPNKLADLYKTLSGSTPYIATNKEIARSILRQLTSQAEPTIDPFYATQLIKLDKLLSGDKLNVTLQ